MAVARSLNTRIREVKSKLKLKVRPRKAAVPEDAPDSSGDFVWVGGFDGRQEPVTVRKRRLNKEDCEKFLRKLSIPFYENEAVTPVKKARHSEVWQVVPRPALPRQTSTPARHARQISAFRAHFEPGPDFKIYEDCQHSYQYPGLGSPVEYLNLEPGNTPAPPLPPRAPRPAPPRVCRASKRRLDFNCNLQPGTHFTLL